MGRPKKVISNPELSKEPFKPCDACQGKGKVLVNLGGIEGIQNCSVCNGSGKTYPNANKTLNEHYTFK